MKNTKIKTIKVKHKVKNVFPYGPVIVPDIANTLSNQESKDKWYPISNKDFLPDIPKVSNDNFYKREDGQTLPKIKRRLWVSLLIISLRLVSYACMVLGIFLIYKGLK